MIRSSQNREGYIRNPWSKENDAIHADVLFKRIEQAAHRGCGLHYEIYEMRVLTSLLEVFDRLHELNETDAMVFYKEAEKRGYDLSPEGQMATEASYREAMADIYASQE